jgi:rhomboid protease GluP
MATAPRNSILCPNCRKLISADEPRCPHCHTAKPGSWIKNNFWTRGFTQSDHLLKTIIMVNAAMYVLSLLMFPRGINPSLNRPLMFLAPLNDALVLLGATGTVPIDQLQRWWTLISANYLHGSLLHIVFNMIVLWQIGNLVVREFGPYRMFIIYCLSGIGGFVASYFFNVPLTVGASAANFGLIGAAMYYGRSRGGPYGMVIYKQLATWAVAMFIFGFLVRMVNNSGHAGGLIAGIALGYILGYHERKKESVTHKLLAQACAVVTLAALGYGVYSSVLYRFQV